MLIYLAQKINKKSLADTEYTYAWTAISTAFVAMENNRKYLIGNNATGHETCLSNAEWADWDLNGRVVFAREGKIFGTGIDNESVCEVELGDLNSNKRIGVKAPSWACAW